MFPLFGVLESRTNTSGRVTFADVAAGEYIISIAGASRSTATFEKLRLDAGGQSVPVVLRHKVAYSVRVHVESATSHPVPDALVELTVAGISSGMVRHTDENGNSFFTVERGVLASIRITVDSGDSLVPPIVIERHECDIRSGSVSIVLE